MKILYLHQYYRTPSMSGGTRSYEFARRLVERGHEVHVVTSDTETSDNARSTAWRVTDEAGAHVHWAPVPYSSSMGYRRRIRSFGHFARVAARRAAAISKDIVFATSTPLTIALPAVYAARRNRVPMVFEVRDLWPELPIALGALRSPLARRAAWALEAWAYRHSKHIIALSPLMAESIQARFPEIPVSTVPNGCDISFFANAERAGKEFRQRTPWLGDRPLILYAGALGFANAVDYIVEMAAALLTSQPEIRIVLAGSGAERETLERLASERGVLSRNLFILGQVPKTGVVELFGACDLAISTLRAESELGSSSPNKVFDAWAAGRPVAINYGGWLADLLRASSAGLVLPPGRPASAAEIVAAFLTDSTRLATARMAARQLAYEQFDRDILFDRVENVLLDVAARREPHRR